MMDENKDLERQNDIENPQEETAGTEPPRHDPYEVEKEWAEKLGMHFDSERAATPPPVPQPENPQDMQQSANLQQQPPYAQQPMYVMPPGTQLPPLHPHGPMPPTYMVWAILATVCCCLPAGVVAILFSSKVSTKYYMRDYEGARKASENAEIWIIVSIVAGIIINALYMPLSLIMSL